LLLSFSVGCIYLCSCYRQCTFICVELSISFTRIRAISLVERARGFAYFFGLLATFFDRVNEYFLSATFVTDCNWSVFAFNLVSHRMGVTTYFFSKQTALFTKTQKLFSIVLSFTPITWRSILHRL
jgi:hypothetical protein